MRIPAALYPFLLAVVDLGAGGLLYRQHSVLLGASLATVGAVVLGSVAYQLLRQGLAGVHRRLARAPPTLLE